MKYIISLIAILTTLIVSCSKQGVYNDLTKDQICAVRKSHVLASYSLNNYYMKYLKKERLDFLQNEVSNQISSFDTLYITEIISLPVVFIKGFVWSDNKTSIEYSFHNTDKIDYNVINRNYLISKNKYYKYFLDINFLCIKNELKNSSPICDGEIVVLIKYFKKDSIFMFDSVIFESFVLYGK